MHPNIDILGITVSIACKKLNPLQFKIVNNIKKNYELNTLISLK